MVNSSLFNSEGEHSNNNIITTITKTNFIQATTNNSQPINLLSDVNVRSEFNSNLPTDISAIEPIPTKTDENSINHRNNDDCDNKKSNNIKGDNDEKTSLFCSVPLDKVQSILSTFKQEKITDNNGVKAIKTTPPTTNRKVLCLYCDRSFVNSMLKEKHIERCHSTKQFRRVSSRRHSNNFTCTPCVYCDRLTTTEHTLKELFEHLISNHSNRYFGCLSCEERFLNASHLADHNASIHNINNNKKNIVNCSNNCKISTTTTDQLCSNLTNSIVDEIPYKITRSRMKANNSITKTTTATLKTLENTKDSKKFRNFDELTTTKKRNNLQNKKLVVKTRRNKRLQQTKVNEKKKKLPTTNDKKDNNNKEQNNHQINDKNSKLTINPYPEFDSFFRVKKITDHSIDNLKISSLTFDDVVFDKAFFNRIRLNIQENLLHYIDGKLFKNEESENRISNFEKILNQDTVERSLTTTTQLSQNIENYGCELTLNAATPTILTTTIVDDLESQIEYGSKASNRKNRTSTLTTGTTSDPTIVGTTLTTTATTTTTTTMQIKNNEINYKYFTRRKYQASILEQKENRDLSKLDMWTQYVIKNRQQKILQSQKTQKEILDYLSSDEYKNQQKRDELNRILDRRGPFEDLREEASKKATLDKLNNDNNESRMINEECFLEVRKLIDNLLDRVSELTTEKIQFDNNNHRNHIEIEEIIERPEIPSYLNLRRTSSISSDIEIDKSDRISLICSSQETEDFELPTNQKREKNEKIELTGEWARSRIYVCAACGLKLQNIKQLLEHKSLYHQYVWVQHYEFVGNQSELYRHLSIPSLGKVGCLEDNVKCKLWKKSDARICTKCNKQCNSLGDLHRHILECGGDWTWMLARKKCRYRPFGSKSRRKRRGLVKRVYPQKSENTEKKTTYKKPFEGPRQKPSDAESIQRMLANLPPKRASRKLIPLKDGFNHNNRSRQQTSGIKSEQQSQQEQKMKCGKIIRRRLSEKRNSQNSQKINNKNNDVNKVITSRILDTNKKMLVKRKFNRNLNTDRITRQSKQQITNNTKTDEFKNDNNSDKEIKTKRKSPRNNNNTNKVTTFVEKMNIKRFFTIKKNINSSQQKDDTQKNGKRKLEKETINISDNDEKNKESFSNLVRTLSLRKKNRKNTNKLLNKEIFNEEQQEKQEPKRRLRSSLKDMVKKICDLKDIQGKNVFLEKQPPETQLSVVPPPQQQETPLSPPTPPPLLPRPSSPPQLIEEKQEEKEIVSTTQDKNPATNSEKIVIPTVVVTQEIDTNSGDLPIMPAPIVVNYCVTNKQTTPLIGTIFNLQTNNEKILQAKCEEEQFHDTNDKTVITTTTTQPSTNIKKNVTTLPKLVSPKGKIKKPTRGLNDCIAMLTNKLNQNSNDSNNIDSIFNLMPYNSNNKDNNNIVNNEENNEIKTKSPNRTLLKVPSYPKLNIKTDNFMTVPNIDKKIKQDSESNKTELDIEKKCEEEIVDNIIPNHQVENHLNPHLVCEDETISMENKSLNVDLSQKNESDDELPLALLCEKKEIQKISSDTSIETKINENHEEADRNSVDNLNLITPETSQELEMKINEEIVENIASSVKDHTEIDNYMDDSGFNSFENRQNEIKTIENEEKENKQNEKNDKIADIVVEENRKQHAKRGRKKKREKTENFLFSFDDEIIHEQNSKNCKKWQEQIIDGDHDSIKMNHEKSLNLPNNTKELSLDSIGEENSEIDLQYNDVIKENNDFIDDTTQTSSTTTRRRSVRSAKTKALEMIIGDALSELTDERNIKNNDFLIEYDHFNDYNCNNNKKRKRKRSIEKKNLQLTKDIVDNEEKKITVEENDKENKKNEKKLSSDELFDLLKSTPCENIVLTKPINSTSFLNNDDISNDFNENHLNTFENILEKTIDVIEENLIDTPPAISMDVFDDNSSDDNVNNDEINKRSIDKDDKTIIKTTKRKRKKRTNKVKSKLLGEEIEIRLENNDNHIELKENNSDNKIIDKSLYCEICDRSFCRAENLMKHKRTLTHISKLSEIEAREAAEKAKLKEQELQQQEQQQIDEEIDEINRNSLDISNEPAVEPPLPSENPNLADIISDVLNKPDLNQNNDIDTIIENDEFKPRYRSLGERKSFDSDNSNNIKSIDYYEPEITKNAGTILEKQISLLENIIENRTNLNFDNDISLSNDSKQDSTNIYVQRENDNNFLKPLPQQQYEEISGDDNNQPEQQPQQKLRKALNRDEELFLECCSLLKSGSEASNYSKKSSNITTVATTTTTTATTTLTNVLNDLDLKTSEEPDWLENKSLNDIISNMNDEYSDTTRMPTPLGDNFIIDDNSNSNTISSNWQLSNNNNDKEWNDKEEQVRSFIFEEISDDEDNRKEQSEIDDVTKFSEIISKAVRKEYQNVNNQLENRDQLNDNSSVNQSIEDKLWDKSEKIDDNDHKKMLTKGAMKIFEGVKVSIPTEDLNMDQVLLNQDNNDSKKLKKLFKIKRPKNLLKTLKKRTNKMKNPTKKSPDIYDFEETQDNTDLLFTKPDFRSFRNEHIKKPEPILTTITTTTEVNDYSDNDESQSFKNNIFESFSSSTSSISDLPNTIKPKSENLTKKKCMIMGRIFKNAAKSRSDDIIRDIPVIDNTKFVEEFVLNCPEPNKQELQKPSMTDREINLEFDKLINPDMDVKKIEETKQLQQQQRKKVKTRKRNRANSDSTDDEFSLNNSTRKRNSKRGHKKEDNSINLEQELKECIGVASRKSQRKCTSGKQNVLVEYWSSDESLFETLNKNETITPTTNNTSGVIESKIEEIENVEEPTKKTKDTSNIPELNRRKRTATNPLYHWSSSSEDEVNDLIEVKPIRDDVVDDDYDEDERPVQHGWIVGDSPKKLVTMLAQAKGKKCDSDCVKEQKKKRTFS